VFSRGTPQSEDLPRSSRRPSPRSSMPEGSPITEADFSPLPPRPRTADRPSDSNNPSNNSRFDS
jgi:hypothetical protein